MLQRFARTRDPHNVTLFCVEFHAHLLRDSFRDKSKVNFIGDLTDDNTLFVGLTETFLNRNILDSEILMEGFNIVRCDRSERMGGGVCFYLKQSINHKCYYLTVIQFVRSLL